MQKPGRIVTIRKLISDFKIARILTTFQKLNIYFFGMKVLAIDYKPFNV